MSEINSELIDLEPIIYGFVELIKEKNSELFPEAWSNLNQLICELKKISDDDDATLVETIYDWRDRQPQKLSLALEKKIEHFRLRGNLDEIKQTLRLRRNQLNKLTNRDYVIETIEEARRGEIAQNKVKQQSNRVDNEE